MSLAVFVASLFATVVYPLQHAFGVGMPSCLGRGGGWALWYLFVDLLLLFEALRAFFAAHNRLDVTMENVCKEVGCETSVCALTRSTGLSLAESMVLVATMWGEDTSAIIGRATSFFSYSWEGTTFREMLDAIESKLMELEASDSVRRYVWLDM